MTPEQGSRLRHRFRQLVICLFFLALLGSIALVIGPFLNDREIDTHRGRALAQVTDTSSLRTIVDFQDEQGIYRVPEEGLLYPEGLGDGQKVWVNYSTANPDLVKVEGRRWTLAIIPALSVAALSTVITIFLWWFIGKVNLRWVRRFKKNSR